MLVYIVYYVKKYWYLLLLILLGIFIGFIIYNNRVDLIDSFEKYTNKVDVIPDSPSFKEDNEFNLGDISVGDIITGSNSGDHQDTSNVSTEPEVDTDGDVIIILIPNSLSILSLIISI